MSYIDRLIELAREASGEENPDVYRYLASASLGLPYSEVTKEQRAEAKRRFYHLLYTDPSNGGLPTPVAEPTLEDAAEMVARFREAFPDLGQPFLVIVPTHREWPAILTGEGRVTIDMESCLIIGEGDRFAQSGIFDALAEYVSKEIQVIASEPVPATKMGAQHREPFWSPSWKRKR